MKNKIILFLLALFLSSVALFNAADAVTINGKSLADITDIVKHANGNLKLEKHSLLFANFCITFSPSAKTVRLQNILQFQNIT